MKTNSSVSVFIHYLTCFRQWGFRGVLDFLNRYVRTAKTKRVLLRNARKFPMTPQRGVTVVADLSSNTSLSKTNRDFCLALKKSGIPYQVYNLNAGRSAHKADVEPLLTPIADFRTLKYDHVVEMFMSPFPEIPGLRKSTIAFWEFTTGFLDAYPFLQNARDVIGMSDFNVDCFRKCLAPDARVSKILYPLRVPVEPTESSDATRQRYGLLPDDFIVFFNFDYESSYARKNPEGCVRAFAKALSSRPNAKLVFKTMRSKAHPESAAALRRLAQELGVESKMVSIDSYIPDADMVNLTNACDVYLSLHRGEGFGLGIAEAMSLGKPVVVTNWSSTTEFCKEGAACAVPCRVVPVPAGAMDHAYYRNVTEWAEPDIDAAADWLRKLYVDSALRQRIGQAGRESLLAQFSVPEFRKSIEAFLTVS